MKKWIGKNWNFLITILVLFVLYFASRLINLTALPIFEDEAIYVRWAQIASSDPSWRFISLTDGKQPLLIWLMIIPIRLFSDPLFAGRIVSVGMGFMSMIGIALLAFTLFKKKSVAFFASFLYLVSPFTLIYDRMALMDSSVSMFYIWSLFFAVLLVKTLRLDIALLLGFSLAGGILTKSSGFLSIYLLPTSLLLFKSVKNKRIYHVLRWGGLILIAILLSQVLYGILRLSPWFGIINQKNALFVYPLTEWFQHPFTFFWGNLRGLINWTTGYLTFSYIVLIVIALVLIKHDWREKVVLVIWTVLPFFALSLFGKVLYPRFILFMMMPLLVLGSWSLGFLFLKCYKRKLLFWILFTILFLYPIFVSTKVLFSIVTAPIPEADKGQYVSGDPSGWGVREIVDVLEREAQDKKITVFTDGTFGLMPYGLEIYLVSNPNIKIIGLWPPPENYTKEMVEAIEQGQAYYIANMRPIPSAWNVKLISQWQKGNNEGKFLKLFALQKSPNISPTEYVQ